MKRLKNWIPILQWLPNYSRSHLGGDLSAGLTVAVMLIPQGMAYAMLAGLPPIVGLYASIVPLAVYAILGTSRQLAVGPVAMVSLMVASAIGEVAPEAGPEQLIAIGVLLAGLVGVIQLVMGVARLGFLVQLLSHPVIAGFTTAAAIIIGLSQLKHLLGVDLPRSHQVHEVLLSAIEQAPNTHGITFAIGLVSIAILLAIKKLAPRLPGALLVVAVSTTIVWFFQLDQAGVRIVGEVPSGLPRPAIPPLDWEMMQTLLPSALTISVVGYLESISVAKAFATRHRYPIDPNQELVALGSANIAGTFFSAYPVTGGFSRTAVNDQAGSKTPLSSLITAAVLMLSLLFLTPLFTYLPTAVLAAIVMVAVYGLIDIGEAIKLFRVRPKDGFQWLMTAVATLTLGIEPGIGLGIAVSLLQFLYRSARPHTAVLGQIPGKEIYRNIARHPDAKPIPGILMLRMDASLYFANASFLQDLVANALLLEREPTHTVILDFSAVNDLDTSAIHALEELHHDLQAHQTHLAFAQVKGPVRDVLDRSEFGREMAPLIFPTVHAAVTAEHAKHLARTAS